MSKIEFSEKDHGASASISLGDVVTVSLPENPTTGYLWVIDSLNEDILSPTGDELTPSVGGGIGGGGSHRFTFISRKVGKGRISLKLWRSWEGDRSVLKRFTIDLVIR